MTLVFACQPLGQLAAALVALIAAVRQRNGIPSDATQFNCDADCRRTLDSIWRWIIGAGVIPAVIALWFRLTIIESPRYTADVARDSAKAASDVKQYLMPSPQMELAFSTSIENQNELLAQRVPLRRSTSSGARSGPRDDASFEDNRQDIQPLSRRSSGAVSVNPAEGDKKLHEIPLMSRRSSGALSVESGARSDDGMNTHETRTEEHNLMPMRQSVGEGSSNVSPLRQGRESAQTGTYLATDAASYHHLDLGPSAYQDDPELSPGLNFNRLSQQARKQFYMTSTNHVLHGNNNLKTTSEDNIQPPAPSWEDFKDYFWHKGNLRTLVATSVCWFCLDLPCKYHQFVLTYHLFYSSYWSRTP